MPTPRKYEAPLSLILETYSTDELTEWIIRNGTYFERVWWAIKLLETDTGDRFTNAQQIAAWGRNQTQAIRVAGFRLQAKLIMAFLGPDQEQKSA